MNKGSRLPQRRIFQLAVFVGLLFLCTSISAWNFGSTQQEGRRVKINVPPEYPELARRMNIKGIARVQIKISPGGEVVEVKEVGGNPVLLESLMRAVKKWKYEPAEKESTMEIKFDFAP